MASPAAWVALVVLLATRAGAGRDVEVDFPSMPVPNEPFATLEHVNVNSGARWSPRVDEFYFDVLRCARDSRVGVVLLKTNEARAKLRNPMPPIANLSWANVGLQQFHLPFGDGMERELGRQKHSQTVRGEMILAWPRAAMAGLRARLEAWGADVGDDFRFAGPHGNRFVVEAVDDAEARKLIGPVDARRGGPDTMFMGTSEGVGIRGVRLEELSVRAGSMSKRERSSLGRRRESLMESTLSGDWCWSPDASRLIIAVGAGERVVVVGSATLRCLRGSCEVHGHVLSAGGAAVEVHSAKTLPPVSLVAADEGRGVAPSASGEAALGASPEWLRRFRGAVVVLEGGGVENGGGLRGAARDAEQAPYDQRAGQQPP